MRYHDVRTCCAALLAAVVLVIAGCGQADKDAQQASSSSPPASEGAAAKLGGPAATVYVFLEGARSGEDQKVTSMLTPLARQELAKRKLWVAPPCSDTARFEVGEIRYPAEDVAHVASRWTDVHPETNEPQHSDMTWILRKEPEGWRVGGMAMSVFEGEPPLLLNFEAPDDMLRQRQMLAAEIARRTKQAESAAGLAEKPEASTSR